MPFAKHRKTNVRTTFLQHDLQSHDNAVQYFLNIIPMQKQRFDTLARNALAEQMQKEAFTIGRSKLSKEAENKPKTDKAKDAAATKRNALKSTPLAIVAQKLLQDGIPQQDAEVQQGRHYYQFLVALYYKEQGYSEQETTKKVMEWALREKQMNRAKSSESEIKQDVTTDVYHIYAKDKKFFATRAREMTFYEDDIRVVQELYEPTLQQIAWAILILGRMYHENGQLYFSIRQLEAMTGISRNTVHRRLIVLKESGFLEVIEHGYYKQDKSMASLYHVPALLNQENKPSFMLTIQATEWNEIYEEALVQIYKQSMIVEMRQGEAE